MSKKYWIYHKKECPLGKIVDETEYETLLKKKWVKNPNEFSSIIESENVHVPRGTNAQEAVSPKIEG